MRDAVQRLTSFPAYLYDLAALDEHAAAVRRAMDGIELYYAVKANPDAELLRVLARHVDGFEVSSGGEFAHVTGLFLEARVAFGGPGKTDEELALAARAHRVHVESPGELRRLVRLGLPAEVLLRLNLEVRVEGAALRMDGPFGMDAEAVAECLPLFGERVRLRGVHAHLASGLAAPQLLQLAAEVLRHHAGEVNVGGGMAVSYADPQARFDWESYGKGLAELRRPGQVVRIEPGRALTAYCGYYATRVIDVKRVHGRSYAIVQGGTHHLRTPVTKGHDQPFTVLPARVGREEPVTVVGQLCTPKDVFARDVPASLRPGDIVVFEMAGAYAWNISHHDFLMHPKPAVHYLPG
ncbi:alanine racemase [Thermoactinospora rubra]|uniref:alanine racemase n=1 Tax=Thermoactinospora rubra TaxID=1088767 RepID=UPI001F0B272F|nr:alanine racemase [Thermoactinospora rubra]